jgi:predicted transcriptional regulator
MIRKKVKKTVQKNCTGIMSTPRSDILNFIKLGSNTTALILHGLNISKQRLDYHLRILVEQNLITRYSRGIYDITEYGKNIHATYEKTKNKKLIRLENMRYKATIYGNVKRILQDMRNPKKSKMKNGVIQYSGKIDDFSVRLFVSQKSNTFEITCQKFLGTNVHELMYLSHKQIESKFNGYMLDPKLKMGTLVQSMKPEFAIPHKFSEIILDMNDASQIRMGGTVYNRSQDRGADWEEDDIIRAGNVMRMPNDIQEILQLVKQPRIVYATNYPMYL